MAKVDNDFSRAQHTFKDRIIARILYSLCYPFEYVDIEIGNIKLVRWYVTAYPDVTFKENYINSVHFLFKTKKNAYRWSFKR